MKPHRLLTTLLMALICFTGCNESDELDRADKQDNYFSDVSSEYKLEGTIFVEIDSDDYADPVLRNLVVEQRLTAVGFYLTIYLKSKDGAQNYDPDGFEAMVRNFSIKSIKLGKTSLDETYRITFSVDVAGAPDLLEQIPGQKVDDSLFFTFPMPAGKSVYNKVPRHFLNTFDPRTYKKKLEHVGLKATKYEEISNSWPDYTAFMEDGVYDITLFFGADHSKFPVDQREAQKAFTLLKESGFTMPVATFDLLEYNSGPAVKTIQSLGQTTELEVRIFHNNLFHSNMRKTQRELAIAEMTTRDVFFYNGHAGPYFGLMLDILGDARLSYKDIKDYKWTKKSQLMIAQGCQTYSQYADMMYASPDKNYENLDVITAVNYSYGEGTDLLLANLIATDEKQNHIAVDYLSLLKDINQQSTNDRKNVFYGVIGIDDNQKLHPYANTETIGIKCQTASDCGDPQGNICRETNRCGVLTLSKNACPAGTNYIEQSENHNFQHACVSTGE